MYPNIVEIDNPDFCIGDLNKEKLEDMWNSSRHDEVKKYQMINGKVNLAKIVGL